MELRHLRYFVAVAEKMNFSEAARSVHITQPSLSQQIQDLERDMGVELIERSNRQIRLTNAGEVFLADAQNILSFADKARNKAKQVENGQIGELRLGFLFPAVHSFMGNLLKQFKQLYPNVSLTIGHHEPAELLKQLHDGQLDIIFTRPYNERIYPDFNHQLVKQDTFKAVLPSGHPLASQTTVSIAQLVEHPLVMFDRDLSPSFYDDIMGQCLENTKIHTISSHEAYLKAMMLMMVSCGMGVGILPSYVEQLCATDCQFIPLTGTPQTVDLLMVRPPASIPNPIVDAFAKLALDTLLAQQLIGTAQTGPSFPYLPEVSLSQTA